jgi:PBSX family phage terminase large subunit
MLMAIAQTAPASPGLSAKQEASIAQSNGKINLWTGSVRSGKTVASLLRWMIYVADAPAGGSLVVSGKTFDTVYRNIFGPLTDPAITGEVAGLVSYTRGAPTATILGREVEVITANDAKAEARLRGLTCAGMYIDEATLIPEDFWTQALARLSVPGSKLFATTNPGAPSHWLRKKYLLRAGETGLRNWHFTLDDNPALDPEYVAWLKSTYTGLWYRRFIRGEWCFAEGAVYDMWDEGKHVVTRVPPISDWLCVAVDYGTTNPLHALLIGIGVNNILYVVDEWRWDSRTEGRQLTDVEYSRRLRDWLASVQLPASQLRGPKPQYFIVDPSAASFKVQLYQDGLSPVDADNAVVDGIRLVSTLLALGKLRVHASCKHLIAEIPGYSWSESHAQQGEDVPVKADDHGLDALRYGAKTTRALWQQRIPLALAA